MPPHHATPSCALSLSETEAKYLSLSHHHQLLAQREQHYSCAKGQSWKLAEAIISVLILLYHVAHWLEGDKDFSKASETVSAHLC